MEKNTSAALPERGTDMKRQSLVVDGCKVTLHFPSRSNPNAMSGIREILATAISKREQADYLQK